MEKYSTLNDLEGLSNKIALMYEEREKLLNKKSFLARVTDTENNDLNDRIGLPKTIQITPELASFLVQDHRDFNAKQSSMINKPPIFGIISAPTKVFFALINPASIPHVAMDIYNTGSRVLAHEKEYNRLYAERSKVASKILENYFLTETKSGEYQLQRANWVTLYYSVSYSYNLDEIGIDRKIDISKLPVIPEPRKEIEKDKGRS